MPTSQITAPSPTPSQRGSAGPRRIRDAEGRAWRVTAVRPNEVLGERRADVERRVTPVESLLDPPVLQRRSGRDRRVTAEKRHGLPGNLLPPAWREGWLLFDAGEEVRRVAPIPPGWTQMPDAELAAAMERTSRRSD